MALGNASWKWNLKKVEMSYPGHRPARTPTPALCANPALRSVPRRLRSRGNAQVSGFAVHPALPFPSHASTPRKQLVGPQFSRTRAWGGARRETGGWLTSRRGGDARAHQRFLALRVRARPRPAAALCGSGVGARHGGGRGQAGPDPDLNASISLRAVGLAAGCA